VALTGEQAVKVKEACQQLLQDKAITIREVAKVLGLLTSSLPRVLYGPLHYRSIEMDKTQALKSNQGNFGSIMALSGEAVADLQWWINSVEETSKPVKQRETRINMTTVVKDAHLGRSQSDCRKKSRDRLSTNQIAGFGGVVIQDGGPENCVTKSVTWGVTRYQIRQKNRK